MKWTAACKGGCTTTAMRGHWNEEGSALDGLNGISGRSDKRKQQLKESAWSEADRSKNLAASYDISEFEMAELMGVCCPDCEKPGVELRIQFCTNNAPFLLTPPSEEWCLGNGWESQAAYIKFADAARSQMAETCLREGWVLLCDDCQRVAAHILIRMS